MADITRDNIEDALKVLRKARLWVSYAEVVTLDVVEKVSGFIDHMEREVGGLTPASEAGGRETDTPNREEKITYIKESLEAQYGKLENFEQGYLINSLSDEQVDTLFAEHRRRNYVKWHQTASNNTND